MKTKKETKKKNKAEETEMRPRSGAFLLYSPLPTPLILFLLFFILHGADRRNPPSPESSKKGGQLPPTCFRLAAARPFATMPQSIGGGGSGGGGGGAR
jgi:hypothetical protein